MTNILQHLKTVAKNGIQSVVGGSKMAKWDIMCPSIINDVIEELGGEMLEVDTNGWQVDYWIKFGLDGKVYTYSGSIMHSSGGQFYLDGDD